MWLGVSQGARFALALTLAATMGAGGEPPLPEPLAKVIAARRAIRSADIEWSILRANGSLAGIELFQRTRYAPSGDRIEEDLGDFEGRQPRREEGKITYVPAERRRVLFKGAGGAFDLSGATPTVCELSEPLARSQFPHPMRGDVRTVGMGLRYRYESAPEDAIWAGVDREFTGPPLRFTQRREGAFHVVEAEFETKQRVVWEIDPHKGWNARRVCFVHSDGSVPMEVDVTLRDYGGTWFPQVVEYRSMGEVTGTIQIVAARFGADLPAQLTLTDIGIEPGMRVVRRGEAIAFAPVWDGERLIPAHEWEALVRRGDRTEGPAVRRYREHLAAKDGRDPPLETLRRAYTLRGAVEMPLSSWRQYMERVVWAFQLDGEQKQRCELTLRSVEQEGRRQADLRKDDFEALEGRLTEAKRNLSGAEADVLWDKLDADIRAALAFLQTLFDEELVPRLHEIPTRAQRRAAIEARRVPVAWP